MRDEDYTSVSILPAPAWGGVRNNARVTHLPVLVLKDQFGSRVHQVRFSICSERGTREESTVGLSGVRKGQRAGCKQSGIQQRQVRN